MGRRPGVGADKLRTGSVDAVVRRHWSTRDHPKDLPQTRVVSTHPLTVLVAPNDAYEADPQQRSHHHQLAVGPFYHAGRRVGAIPNICL